jgi:hypothetical protein
MTTAATQDRACSTRLMNEGDDAIKRLATSAYGTNQTSSDVRCLVAIGGKPDVARTAQFGRE